MREMKDTSLKSWTGCKSKTQRASAATGGGRVGADDTTLIARAEPSSFGAAGDRLLVHFSSSKKTARPGDTGTSTQSSSVPVKETEQVERGRQLHHPSAGEPADGW